MNKTIAAAVVASAFALANPAFAQPKAAKIQVDASEAVVKLVSVDPKARTAVVQGPSGANFTLLLPSEAQNLDRVKPGDLFKVRYVQSLAISLNKAGTASSSGTQTVELAPKGATPGGKVVSTRQLTATVREIDRGARAVTVVGPGGNAATLKVAPDVRAFDEIAIGDTITVSYTEAVAMEMVPETAAEKKAR